MTPKLLAAFVFVGLSGCVDPGTAGLSHQNGETYDILSLVRLPEDFAAFRRRFGGACLAGPMRMCQVVYVKQSSRPGAAAVTRRLAAVELQDGQICRVTADSRAGEARFFGTAIASWGVTISKPFEVPPGEDWLDRGLEACALVAPIVASARPRGIRRAGP